MKEWINIENLSYESLKSVKTDNINMRNKFISRLTKTFNWFITMFIIIILIIITYSAWMLIIVAMLSGLLCISGLGLFYKIKNRINGKV